MATRCFILFLLPAPARTAAAGDEVRKSHSDKSRSSHTSHFMGDSL